MIEIPSERRAAYLRNCRLLALAAGLTALWYLKWLLFDAKPVDHVLYWLLVAAEVFNILQAAGFWITISLQRWTEPPVPDFTASAETVDLFITVCGEPLDIVEQTLAGATAVRHPRKKVWVLDDGGNRAVKELALRYKAGYGHRPERTGAKAGNLNHALGRTAGDFFVILDADQVPHPDFLEAVLGAFSDESVAFVQTPQVYRNRPTNRVAAGAHDQQALFYGPILRGKDGCGATFSCGTNVVFRRSAVEAIGGIPEDSITEDLRASLKLIEAGYTSVYVSRVLAEGLGPMDVASYFEQQLRWGRGGLEILFKRRPYSRKLSPLQALQYTLGFMYWFTGWAYLSYLALPVLFLLGGFQPIQVPNEYPAHFLPYVLTALATIVYAGDFRVHFDGLWFTLGSFPTQMRMLFSTLSGRVARFVVTPKQSGTVSLRPVRWHIAVMAGLVLSAIIGLVRFGPQPTVVNNVAWIVGHLVVLQGFVRLTLAPERTAEAEDEEAEERSGAAVPDALAFDEAEAAQEGA